MLQTLSRLNRNSGVTSGNGTRDRFDPASRKIWLLLRDLLDRDGDLAGNKGRLGV
jgi:hypothetical protein